MTTAVSNKETATLQNVKLVHTIEISPTQRELQPTYHYFASVVCDTVGGRFVGRIKAGDGICWFGQYMNHSFKDGNATPPFNAKLPPHLRNRRVGNVEYLVQVGYGVSPYSSSQSKAEGMAMYRNDQLGGHGAGTYQSSFCTVRIWIGWAIIGAQDNML